MDQRPRILYLSDVVPQESLSGSLLMYRLLQDYPPDRLHVLSSSIAICNSRRLPNVRYEQFFIGPQRLLLTRVGKIYKALLTASMPLHEMRIRHFITRKHPDAIVTVVHGYAWITATLLAIRYNIPLHLIIHDDWPSSHGLYQPFSGFGMKFFELAIATAASRMCISPTMAQIYERRYGQSCEVLLPTRDQRIDLQPQLADVSKPKQRQLTIAYAGSLYTPAYVDLIQRLCRAMRDGDRLLIFSPHINQLSDLNHSVHVDLRPVLPPLEVLEQLRREADILFVPMSFAPNDQWNMKLAFPSKLADYTAVGLPLLIWGPEYSSVVRWGRSNPGVAEIVSQLEEDAIRLAVQRLSTSLDYRQSLAREAVRVGHMFAQKTVASQFLKIITDS